MFISGQRKKMYQTVKMKQRILNEARKKEAKEGRKIKVRKKWRMG